MGPRVRTRVRDHPRVRPTRNYAGERGQYANELSIIKYWLSIDPRDRIGDLPLLKKLQSDRR